MRIKLDPGAFMPEYAHEQDAGMDLRSPVNAVVLPHDSAIIHTGIHVEIPHGYVGFLKSKSGLNLTTISPMRYQASPRPVAEQWGWAL